MIYLASPYSHEDKSIEEYRFAAVCRAAGAMLLAGHNIYSPIAMSHPIAVRVEELAGEWEDWARVDTDMVGLCEEFWILALPGWDTSRGIKAEVTLARSLGKTIRLVDTDGNELELE